MASSAVAASGALSSERPPDTALPPGSAPVARGPALPVGNRDKPSTSAFVSRMNHRPNVDSQAAQLAAAELQLAIRNAQVSFLCTHILYDITGMSVAYTLYDNCLEFPFQYTANKIQK